MVFRAVFVTILAAIWLLCMHQAHLVHAAGRTIRLPLISSTTKGEGTFGQPVINYYVPITLGNPPKPFKVQFDVGINDFFVPHYSFNPFTTNLHYKNGFQCKDSSTCHRFNKSVTIDYQNNKLKGKVYEDVLTLSGINVPGTQTPLSLRQQFLAMSDASNGKLKNLPIDGIIGLGPIPQATSAGSNLIGSLLSAKYIDNLQFSMRFSPLLDSKQGGDLILGGVETSLYQGQIYWHQLTVSGTQWSLNLHSVALGDQSLGCYNRGCEATISSGVNEIYGPREDVRLLYNLLNTVRDSSGIETIDCRRIPSLPMLTFFLDGIPHALLPTNYIRKLSDSSLFKKEICYVAVLPSDDAKTWLLGTSFLGAYYSVFDMTYRQVGFAALK